MAPEFKTSFLPGKYFQKTSLDTNSIFSEIPVNDLSALITTAEAACIISELTAVIIFPFCNSNAAPQEIPLCALPLSKFFFTDSF